MSNPNTYFTEKEINIVKSFLAGESIRTLVEPGWGRTKIRNLLIRYGKENIEVGKEIDNRLFKNRTHKSDNSEIEFVEISDKQIADAYEQIKSGKSLTECSKELKRTRGYIKNRIIEYLNDSIKVGEFLNILRKNQFYIKDVDISEIDQLEESERWQIIFDKLNTRRTNLRKRKYKEGLLERKLNRLKKYFLEDRNQNIIDEKEKISEMDLWKMIYDMPELLAYSFSNKIKPAIQNLDNNPSLGFEKTNQIIKEEPAILGSSIDRTNLQIRILQDSGLLDLFLAKPRYFRTSPEFIYALIKLSKDKSTDEIFITKSRLQERHNISPENLMKRYNARDEYGDDEYFDK